MFELQGKVCLVTGSAGGIGLEVVKLFLQKGAKCLMVDVNYRVSQPVTSISITHTVFENHTKSLI